MRTGLAAIASVWLTGLIVGSAQAEPLAFDSGREVFLYKSPTPDPTLGRPHQPRVYLWPKQT